MLFFKLALKEEMVGTVIWFSALAFASFWTYKYVHEVMQKVPEKEIFPQNAKSEKSQYLKYLARLNKTNSPEAYSEFKASLRVYNTTLSEPKVRFSTTPSSPSSSLNNDEEKNDEESTSEDDHTKRIIRRITFEEENANDAVTTDIPVLNNRRDFFELMKRYPKLELLKLPSHIKPKYIDETTDSTTPVPETTTVLSTLDSRDYRDKILILPFHIKPKYIDENWAPETTTVLSVMYAQRNLYQDHKFFKSKYLYDVKSNEVDEAYDEIDTTEHGKRYRRENDKYILNKMFIAESVISRHKNDYHSTESGQEEDEDDDDDDDE